MPYSSGANNEVFSRISDAPEYSDLGWVTAGTMPMIAESAESPLSARPSGVVLCFASILVMTSLGCQADGPREELEQGRIINGEDQTEHVPYFTAIFREDPNFIVHLDEKRFGCGGTLITPCHVVTAAHCLPDLDADQVTVRVGAHALDSQLVQDPDDPSSTKVLGLMDDDNGGFPYHESDARALHIHPDYDPEPTPGTADIAIIELAECAPAEFDPVPMADSESFSNFLGRIESELTVYGLGLQSVALASEEEVEEDTLMLASTLQTADLDAKIDDEFCDLLVESYGADSQPGLICMRPLRGERTEDGPPKQATPCAGDSGSPLVFFEEEGPYFAGVHTSGVGTCGARRLLMSQSVSYHRAWLDETVCHSALLSPIFGPWSGHSVSAESRESLRAIVSRCQDEGILGEGESE